MRIKSSIVRWDFWSFRSLDENVANEVNEQVVDAIFTRFDTILNVDKERDKRFDKIICFDVATEITNEISRFLDRSEEMTNLDIEIFVVVLNEIVEIVDEIVDEILIVDEIVDEILSFSLLKLRFEALTIIFFTDFVWCW